MIAYIIEIQKSKYVLLLFNSIILTNLSQVAKFSYMYTFFL